MKNNRVLSIQSHTVHSYVGNKCAIFPLQLLGLDVDSINTVQYSNHTGYKSFKGHKISYQNIVDLISGLEDNLLLNYEYLLTGYIGSIEILNSFEVIAKKLNKNDFIFLCDPVMGDDGKLYVPKESINIYKDKIIPLATIITPNQFECEMLTDIKIHNEKDLIKACTLLHQKGPKIIVVTSSVFNKDEITIFASQILPNTNLYNQYKVIVKKLPGKYAGTGDLFAALFLAWYSKLRKHIMEKTFLKIILEKVVSTIQFIMLKTLTECGEGAEIRLIQSKNEIENPPVLCMVTSLHINEDEK